MFLRTLVRFFCVCDASPRTLCALIIIIFADFHWLRRFIYVVRFGKIVIRAKNGAGRRFDSGFLQFFVSVPPMYNNFQRRVAMKLYRLKMTV